jgi:hypothetical protein
MNDPSQTPSPAADAPLQFERAEMTDNATASACTVCKRQLRSYFDVNGLVVCPTCKENILASVQGGSGFARFMKAGLLGTGAAVVGALGYWAITAATGYNLGLIAIAVGWLVGTAVAKGAENRGGWFYQVLAVVLTYLSIGVSLIPEVLKASEANSEGGAARVIFGIIVAFTGPVIVGVSSPISGLIYGFGLWEAGRRNKKAVISVNGPFQVKEPAEQPEAAPQPALADASNS